MPRDIKGYRCAQGSDAVDLSWSSSAGPAHTGLVNSTGAPPVYGTEHDIECVVEGVVQDSQIE